MERKTRITDRLTFRIIFPMVVLFLFLGLGLYVFVLRSVSNFEGTLIGEELEWISRGIFSILDEEYYQMLVSGSAGDERLVLLRKGQALGKVEDFMNLREFRAVIFSEVEERNLLSFGITDDLVWRIMGVHPENEVLKTEYGGEKLYAYQFQFEPWQWRIIFTKGVTGYAALLARVRTAYAATAVFLLLSAVLFYYYLNTQIRNPITEIISSLSRKEQPRYRGIREFEFLSNNIHQMMQTLEENTKWIDSFLSTIGALIIVTDPGGRIVLFNRTCEEVTGFGTEAVKGKLLWEILIPQNLVQAFRRSFIGILEDGSPSSFESPLLTASGQEIAVLWNKTIITGAENEVRWFIATGLDITNMIRIKEELQESKQFLTDIFDSIQDGICILDTEMNIIGVNPVMEKWYSHKMPLKGRKCSEVVQGESSGGEDCPSEETLKTGRTSFKVVPRIGPGGVSTGWLELFSFPFIDKATGRMKGVIVYMRDITDRKYAEEQLKSSLREKEVLLKEIHHRVKNNLQVISSLLNLQAQHISGRDLIDVYKDSQNRVVSMALIHEELYQSKDLAQVSFAKYIKNLARNLFVSYGIKNNRISLEIDVEELNLTVDTAIPCGLIVNELLSNILKHAFPKGRKGRIRVCFQSLPEDCYSLVVADDGVGLPEDLDPAKTTSLGMQLVVLLVEQLGGTLELDRREGTSFTIIFREYQEAGVGFY